MTAEGAGTEEVRARLQAGALRGRRALVVVNPVSGRGRGRRAAGELCEGLRARGADAELLVTSGRGDVLTRLRTRGDELDLVVSVGGDGTLREVLEGLVDPEIPVGILPYGTANVLARQLGLPRDVHHAVEVLDRGRSSELDVARVNGKLSFLVTGVGLDALAVREVDARRTGPITRWSYLAGSLRALRGYRPPRLRVHVEGRELPGTFGLVLVSNPPGYAGLLKLARDTRLDDGLFETYLFPTGGVLELLRACLRGLLVGLPGGRVQMERARRVRIEAPEPVPYQVDGDPGGTTPVEIEVSATRYRLIVP